MSFRARLQAMVPDWVTVYVCVPDEEELEAKGQREVVFLAQSGAKLFHVQLTLQAADRVLTDADLARLYVGPVVSNLEGFKVHQASLH